MNPVGRTLERSSRIVSYGADVSLGRLPQAVVEGRSARRAAAGIRALARQPGARNSSDTALVWFDSEANADGPVCLLLGKVHAPGEPRLQDPPEWHSNLGKHAAPIASLIEV